MAKVITHECDSCNEVIDDPKDVVEVNVTGALTSNIPHQIILHGDCFEAVMEESETLKGLVFSDDD